jgi:membrane-associated phospholipid phosphatase
MFGLWKSFATALLLPACVIAQSAGSVEPGAGSWRTWIISSGKDFRVPPPPDAAGTQAELSWLKDFSSQSGVHVNDQIRFWDAGPTYRWEDLVANRFVNGRPLSAFPVRAFTYVSLAIYDATIAAWESKYFYNRPRPSQVDPSLRPRVGVPNYPSYPSDYAAAAAAASEVLAYLVPAEAASFRALAEEAGRSRLLAGVEYLSDYTAGLELGKRVAAEVIAKARADGSDAVWDGRIPTGPCMWTGANPGNATGLLWKPLLLSSPSEFRPPPPPACTSPQVQAELAEVRNFPRALTAPLNSTTFTTNWKAFYWQTPAGSTAWANIELNRWILEDKLNPPRAARASAAAGAAFFDAFIASQDGKFTYWYLRPAQLDPNLVPLFPAPNFPSYPSNHSTFSTARGAILAYLFPERADYIKGLAKEAGDSRIWAGIHYQMDNVAGVELGAKVAQKVIDRVSNDGAQ